MIARPGQALGITVVIPAYNAARTIARTIEACRAQDIEVPLEVIVVDDGSTDGTEAIAKGAGATVLRQTNAGPACARNRGWRAAGAPIVLFTDSDCVPHSDWARKMAGALDSVHPVACGSYGIANESSALARTIHAEIRWRHSRLPETVEFAGSYNLAATRDALEAVGGFDEAFRDPSGEDNDLSYRLRDAGHLIRFVRDALVDHLHTEDLGRYLREQARHGRWRVALYAAHPGRARGDGYAGGADFAAPPLAILSVVAASFAPWIRSAWLVAVASAACVVVIHAVLAARVAQHDRSTAALLLLPVGFVRAYARGAGLLQGVGDLVRRRGRP